MTALLSLSTESVCLLCFIFCLLIRFRDIWIAFWTLWWYCSSVFSCSLYTSAERIFDYDLCMRVKLNPNESTYDFNLPNKIERIKTLCFRGALLLLPFQLQCSMKLSVNIFEKLSTIDPFCDFRYPICILENNIILLLILFFKFVCDSLQLFTSDDAYLSSVKRLRSILSSSSIVFNGRPKL